MSMLRFRLPLPRPALAFGVSVAAVAGLLSTPIPGQLHHMSGGSAAFGCPAGYESRDPVALAREFRPTMTERAADLIRGRFGDSVCVWKKLPESLTEAAALKADRAAMLGEVPQGLMQRAVDAKNAGFARQKAVANASGQWEQYGKGSQIYDATYEASSGNDGIYDVMGRVDDFAYDETHKRLFAAVGNGGIWMSEAVDGDVATLGDLWKPIHGGGTTGLGTLVTSAVEWTPAAGGANGRVLALTGEHTQGGNAYVGLGAWYSDDLGATWKKATGVPDGAFSFVMAVDQSNPRLVYAATGKGLFRSTDAGANYTNVALPVSETCQGNTTNPVCGFANFVTGLAVKAPEGDSDPDCANGCPVVASVGYRAGNIQYASGDVQSPGNGFYKSPNGAPGSFVKITNLAPSVGGTPTPFGLPEQARLGRIEMAAATGAGQDKNYLYAIIQDARLFNGTAGPVLDSEVNAGGQLPVECGSLPGGPNGDPQFVCNLAAEGVSPTYLNGIYVSGDFGDTWTLMADDAELVGTAGVTGSSLSTTAALGVGPGIQSWYNQWLAVDPTQQLNRVPTRIAFGLEEIWTNAANTPQDGTTQSTAQADFKVIGTYFAGKTCAFLIGNVDPVGTPTCPTSSTTVGFNRITTHPDQQGAIFIPDEAGGVWLFAGNDGGVQKQLSSGPTDPFSNDDWSPSNNGFYTLLNYGIAVSGDGTVWYGLQDNTSGKILPDDTRKQIRIYIGDGMWTAVHPTDSNIAYYQTPGLSLNKTTDGGVTTNSADDFDVGTAHFLGPFHMDDTNPDHLMAVGTKVAVTTDGAASWTTVYDLGANANAGGALFQARTRPLDIHGAYLYAGACGPCNLVGSTNQFQNKISTNVGGADAPAIGSPAGWHDAAMAGLPNRFIYNIHIDRDDPTGKTIYVVLGGYSPARWAGVGQFGDTNTNVQKGKNVWVSKDAGQTFTSIQGNLPDVISTYIIKRRNQLIVATDVGLFISSDLTGTEWVPMGDHPNVPVNQLVLKPGDDTQLFSGTFGRGVLLYTFKAGDTGGGPGGGTGGLPTIVPVTSVVTTSTTGGSQGRFGGGALGLPLALAFAGAAWLTRRRKYQG